MYLLHVLGWAQSALQASQNERPTFSTNLLQVSGLKHTAPPAGTVHPLHVFATHLHARPFLICRVHLGNQPENCVTVTTGTMVKGGLSNEVENGSAIAPTMPGCKMSSAPTHHRAPERKRERKGEQQRLRDH